MIWVLDLRQLLLQQHGLPDRDLGIVFSLEDQDAGRYITYDVRGVVQGEVGCQPGTGLDRLIGEHGLDLLFDQRLQVAPDAEVAPPVRGYDRMPLVLFGRIVPHHQSYSLKRSQTLARRSHGRLYLGYGQEAIVVAVYHLFCIEQRPGL